MSGLATTSQGNHLTLTWIITDGEGRMEKPKKYHHHHYHHQLTITGNNLRHSTVQSAHLKTLTSHHLTMALSKQGGKNVETKSEKVERGKYFKNMECLMFMSSTKSYMFHHVIFISTTHTMESINLISHKKWLRKTSK